MKNKLFKMIDLTKEQQDAIERNFRLFCQSSGIKAAFLFYHFRDSKAHGVAIANPHLCSEVWQVSLVATEFLEGHGINVTPGNPAREN